VILGMWVGWSDGAGMRREPGEVKEAGRKNCIPVELLVEPAVAEPIAFSSLVVAVL